MDFLKAIEPHNDRLDAFEKNGSWSGDINQLRQLRDIYNKYVYQGKGDVKANITCSQCTAKMMQRLVTHRSSLSIRPFKPIDGTPQVVTIEVKDYPAPVFENMSFQELKSIASKHINTYKKSKEDLIKWLKENS